jgi:transcriptional regulator with XRE-family HTH domain
MQLAVPDTSRKVVVLSHSAELDMSREESPAVSRRRLAMELRLRRLEAGRTIQDVADYLEVSAGKISRLETGLVAAHIQDVRGLLDLYNVDAADRERILNLTRQSRKKAWWNDYTDVVPPAAATFYGLEDGAATIQQYSTALVPGLFQTTSYARALIKSQPSILDSIVERRLALRMRRQMIVIRDTAPQFQVVLDEAVLRRVVGGNAVMLDQLRHLIELAHRPHITLQVLPFAHGAHVAAGAAFTIFGFADSADPSIVYLEQLTRNTHLEQPDEVAQYIFAFDEVRVRARSHEDSLDMLRQAAGSFS